MNERELPDLRVLPADTLVLHEETDPDRTARLTAVLAQDQTLKNPPIVAHVPDSDRFVVLDGANRTESLRALGMPHVLVQVVEYDRVRLDTWNHVVTGMESDVLFDAVRGVSGLTLFQASLTLARELLTARRCLGYLICPSGDVYVMRGGHGLEAAAQRLTRVVRAYKGIGKIYRIKTDLLAEQSEYYDDITAILVFPHFTPADIINLATTDQKMPTGITRHVIPLRALRVNYPLARLANPTLDTAAKNAELQGFIRERLQARGVRFYEESTVLFDE